jgi:hypothetical protein
MSELSHTNWTNGNVALQSFKTVDVVEVPVLLLEHTPSDSNVRDVEMFQKQNGC